MTNQAPMRPAHAGPSPRRRASRLVFKLAFGSAMVVAAQITGAVDTQGVSHGVAPKTVVDLQPYRQLTTAQSSDGQNIDFTSLNPTINAWFLLHVGGSGGAGGQDFHLENPYPSRQQITLSQTPTPTLVLTRDGHSQTCAPWDGAPSALQDARATHLPYAPLCGGALYLRNPQTGYSTTLEWTANFLRNNVWGGDMIVGLVKDTIMRDAYSQAAVAEPASPDAGASGLAASIDLVPAASRHPTVRSRIGLHLDGTPPGKMDLGAWYQVHGVPGVFASAMAPSALDTSILNGPGTTNPLDRVEAHSMDYMVAFDLSKFDLGYALGTQHPGLGWSPRAPASVRDASLPGPDGIKSPAPLVPLGMIDPALAPSLVATFTAGFKRRHGAFEDGPLSRVNHGSHYGFVEQGVVLSTLQPGLSTLFVLDDGSLHLKTWSADDNALLPHIRFARQNGVPLLERNPDGGTGVPGSEVTSWLGGNWSGSADLRLRTLRSGACLLKTPTARYLVFGYFSTATPSAMARTFEGYGCTYAMHLDMNALVHTYLALYPGKGSATPIEHLIPGMAADKRDRNGHPMARFVDYPDNRDFFYLLRRPG